MRISKRRYPGLIAAMALSGLALAATTAIATNPDEPYWLDSNGKVIRDGSGNCVRTVMWRPELGTAECGEAPKVEAKPEPVKEAAPAPVAASLSADTLFAFDSSKLTDKGKQTLGALAKDITGLKSVTEVLVDGHTCSIGTDKYNQGLSERRANAVKTFLEQNGVKATIKAVGHGEAKPKASNKTREGRSANRRVEITVKGTR